EVAVGESGARRARDVGNVALEERLLGLVELDLVAPPEDHCSIYLRRAPVLTTRFTELVGCEIPLQQAGMGGVAGADLAAAVSAGRSVRSAKPARRFTPAATSSWPKAWRPAGTCGARLLSFRSSTPSSTPCLMFPSWRRAASAPPGPWQRPSRPVPTPSESAP